jgi:hypothetical protein
LQVATLQSFFSPLFSSLIFFLNKKMSNFTDIKDAINRLETSITNGYKNYYEYSEFKNIQLLGSGAYGSVIRANWKNTDTFLAVKSFNNQESTLYKEVVSEV